MSLAGNKEALAISVAALECNRNRWRCRETTAWIELAATRWEKTVPLPNLLCRPSLCQLPAPLEPKRRRSEPLLRQHLLLPKIMGLFYLRWQQDLEAIRSSPVRRFHHDALQSIIRNEHARPAGVRVPSTITSACNSAILCYNSAHSWSHLPSLPRFARHICIYACILPYLRSEECAVAF